MVLFLKQNQQTPDIRVSQRNSKTHWNMAMSLKNNQPILNITSTSQGNFQTAFQCCSTRISQEWKIQSEQSILYYQKRHDSSLSGQSEKDRQEYLAVDRRDDDRAQPHPQHQTTVKVLVQHQWLKQRHSQQQSCVHVPLPHVLTLVFGELNQQSAHTTKWSLLSFCVYDSWEGFTHQWF